jgi:hypothetical protein
MIQFPHNYKIVGYQLNINDFQTVIRRKTLTMLEVFGLTGGLLRFINFFLGKVVGFFKGTGLSSLLALALYT